MIIQIPSTALKELQQLEDQNLSVSAQQLVDWVNHAAERFLPRNTEDKSQRVSDSLSLRSMRHYQTLGCIDVPVREGREALYGFRHYLQALLVRKMLCQRVPSEKMAQILSSKTISEYKNLLLQGIELVVKPTPPQNWPTFVGGTETWKRLRISEGVELHLHQETGRLAPKSIPVLLEKIEAVLRGEMAANRKQSSSLSK
jgi:DNA-binding transcriptional MerR regulator